MALDLLEQTKRKEDAFLIIPQRKAGASPKLAINWNDGKGFFDNFVGAINLGVWTKSTSGDAEIFTSNRVLTVKSEGNGDSATITQKFSGTQSNDGDMTVKGRFKKSEEGTAPVIKIGFIKSTNAAAWSSIAGTVNKEMVPHVRLGANTTNGSAVSVPSGTWHDFKIIVRTNEADFYLNGTLVETLTSNVPDTTALSAGVETSGTNADDKAQIDVGFLWGVHGS